MDSLWGLDIFSLIRAVGLLGVLAIVFAESGLLFGFFLPGDSLLFAAGFLAAQDYFNIWILIVGCFAAAVLGDNVGYAFGQRAGPRIFKREESLFFNPGNLEAARRFYERHGGKAIVLARFFPAIRTFAPILAGVALMNYRRFFFYNLTGALLWAVGLPSAGYFLGQTIPNADRYLLPVIFGIVVLSLLPSLAHLWRDRESRRRITALIKKFYNGRNGGKSETP